MGGGSGDPFGPQFQSYQFHGDPFATFSSFFGDEDPFKDLFGDNGGFGGPVSYQVIMLSYALLFSNRCTTFYVNRCLNLD